MKITIKELVEETWSKHRDHYEPYRQQLKSMSKNNLVRYALYQAIKLDIQQQQLQDKDLEKSG